AANGAELKVGFSAKWKDRDYGLFLEEDLVEDDYGGSDGRFMYSEDRFDVYGLVKWNLSPSVVLETGVRAEGTKTTQQCQTVCSEGGVAQETESGSADNSVFMLNPSAHLQWKLTDSDQLRFSVAKTVRRPAI